MSVRSAISFFHTLCDAVAMKCGHAYSCSYCWLWGISRCKWIPLYTSRPKHKPVELRRFTFELIHEDDVNIFFWSWLRSSCLVQSVMPLFRLKFCSVDTAHRSRVEDNIGRVVSGDFRTSSRSAMLIIVHHCDRIWISVDVAYDAVFSMTLTGGDLNGTFVSRAFYLHWDTSCRTGSEHQICCRDGFCSHEPANEETRCSRYVLCQAVRRGIPTHRAPMNWIWQPPSNNWDKRRVRRRLF